MTRIAFQVFDVDHWTMPDLIETLQLIGDEDEAATFMDAYEAVCGDDTAVFNLRYMLNLIGGDEALRIADLFMVEIPGKYEVLSPRQTFGMSSLGVTDKPLPDYSEKPKKPKAEYVAPTDDYVEPARMMKTNSHPKKKVKLTRTMITEAPSTNGNPS